MSTFLEQANTDFPGSAKLWIGATKTNNNTTWTWSDGSALDFIDWKANEVLNGTNVNCAILNLVDGLWSAVNCYEQNPYICVTPPISDVSTLSPPTSCDEGWLYFAPANACYLEFNETGVQTWQPAEAICVEHGAHLASLHSEEEAKWILGKIELTNNSR